MASIAQATPPLTLAAKSRSAVHGQAADVGVPWYLWTGALAVTSASIGGAWDVSWHRSIGRDSFWTAAHIAIYMCGVLAGVVGLWLVSQATADRDSALRAASVSIVGLWAPLGVFVAGWGGLAMLTSAPFDNWWHNAYGLDVKIVSPPHTLLILGARAVGFGMLFLILAAMNRAADAGAGNFRTLRLLFLYVGGLTVGGHMFFLQELTADVRSHTVLAYSSVAIAVPVLFATFSQASRFRWAATTTAAVYTLFIVAEILILPLFPAQPKLGPVYFPVTHLVPAKFPVLILAPAFALDLLWQRTHSWKLWQVALVSGAVFVGVLFAVQWPFGTFLLSKGSENRFFGSIYHEFAARPESMDRLRRFFQPDAGSVLAWGIARAAIYATVSTWVGLYFGRWMRTVRR